MWQAIENEYMDQESEVRARNRKFGTIGREAKF